MLSFLIIGILVLVVGIVANNSYNPATAYSGIIKIAGVIIFAVGTVISAIVQVDTGEIGVQKLLLK